ncbi:MAG TPA: ABC transporter ATP-binding protein [Candidatus Paceibacterota bacterium]
MSLFRRIMKYLWPQMRKHKGALYATVFFFVIRVVIDFVIVPIYFKKFIDLISNDGPNHALLSNQIMNLVFIIIGLTLVVTITARLRGFAQQKFIVNTTRDLRDYVFQKIEQNSQTFFSNTFAGSLVTKSRRFVNSFESMFEVFVFNFTQVLVVLIGVFVVLIGQSKLISAILFGLVFVYLTVVFLLIRQKSKFDMLEAEQDSKISGRLADVFSNILAVKFFSARKQEIGSFGEYTKEGARRANDSWRYGNIIDVIQSVFSFIIHGTILYVVVRLWLNNDISTGTVVLVETYVTLILSKLWDLSNSMVRFMKGVSDMKEVIDIFEIVPDILDPKKPEKLKVKEGRIVFDQVGFKYAMGFKLLQDFNLEINPGERVGIVGHSGAGKSTLTKVILRFNDISEGAITIDGQDIRNLKQDDLRSVISYVPQEPLLFHRPIRENINYGKPNATYEEIVEVAKKAHAHEFIERLPKGYDTLVGERGVKLSGGERQRVAIARAMLKDAPILILDEATSSLDSISESYIQEAFSELMKGKTTLVIAHRLSTVQRMDRIIVLDKGKIVEEGTHKELLALNGSYADLWNHQTGGFLE